MPEGDVVYRTAAGLRRALLGQALVVTDFRWPSLATVDLAGGVTTEVVSVGKHLLHRLDTGWTIHSHLRMDGSWRIARPDAPLASRPPAAARVVLATNDWAAVGLRLGELHVVRTADESTLVGQIGPDLLGQDFKSSLVVSALIAEPRGLGEALLDQAVVAGLGTIWTSESLFWEQLNPWLPAASLSSARLTALIDRARKLLRRAASTSPWPIDTRRGSGLQVYGMEGRPCRRCGTLIQSGPCGQPPHQRRIAFCPICQPSGG